MKRKGAKRTLRKRERERDDNVQTSTTTMMNVIRSAAATAQVAAVGGSEDASSLSSPHHGKRTMINLYGKCPTAELSLDDFEIYALRRLKVRFQPSFARPSQNMVRRGGGWGRRGVF